MTPQQVAIGAGLLVCSAYMLTRRPVYAADLGTPATVDPPAEGDDQTATLMDSLLTAFSPSSYAAVYVDDETAATNLRAVLDMIAWAEGTDGPDGYRTMFGHRLFDSYADHPRQLFQFTDKLGRQLKTSAAGRYQFLQRTWDELRDKLGLQDFSPESQDLAACELIRQRGALADAQNGDIVAVVTKCAPIWASLPGAGYAQPERKIQQLAAAYTDAGGTINEG